ncbi:hypothetical protein FHX48_000879 [Microbacterium halimionae]|uniref:DUF4307 domain-containing protein n=1 Tax=Microbacterium halimionae TaxID=1526413 RepID=A0A7W3JMZ2_9MICO|nr:DUF4307 domain-containing protein [Microbacterium halimionae]MBA8815827.1 hypothetical protein [Microbacterium halimionae]NII95873.1 hypothetical protein [Microbacterium halimionae]
MTTQEKLDARYGRGRLSAARRGAYISGSVVAIAALGCLAWGAVSGVFDTVDAVDTGYSLVSEHQVDVRFQVTAQVGATVACAIEAQDEDHGIVGWRIVEYEASTDATHSYTETIPTLDQATTGFVNSCWVS